MTGLKLAAILAVGGVVSAAQADIAYNSFGAGDTFDVFGYGIGGGQGDDGQGIAMQFSSLTTGTVSLIKLALAGGYNYNVSINVDDNGLPGQALESWSEVVGSAPCTVYGDGSASLTTGSLYWVTVQPTSDDHGFGEWFDGVTFGTFADNQDGGQWRAGPGGEAAYRVETMPVPEPASAAALALGAAAIATRRKRKA